MTIKGILAMLLVSAMTVSTLAGCGNKERTSSSKDLSDASKTSSNSIDKTDTNFTGYPMDTDKKLTIWSSNMAGMYPGFTSYTESPFHNGLAEMTGVDVEWLTPAAGTDANQAYNLMLASDVLPDIIAFTLYGSSQQLLDDGIIRDLSKELPAYSPNYWNLLQSNEHINKSVRTDKSQYFGYGGFRQSDWGAVYIGPVVRKDWLDEQKLSIPTTIAEWDTVLRTFKEAYNAPMAFFTARMNRGLASAFGAYNTFGSSFFVDDNGKVQYSFAQPEWKEYMTQLHTWYADGLIDPDSVTLDDAGMRSKALNNQFGISVTAISQLTNWTNDAVDAGTGAEWIGIPWPTNEAKDPLCTIYAEDIVNGHIAAITTSCPDDKVELAMRWLDYGYSEEGFMYWNYGKEGESYTIVDGKPKYTDLLTKDPEGLNTVIAKYVGTAGVGMAVQADDMVAQKNHPVAVAAVDTWVGCPNNGLAHLYPNSATLTTEESEELGNIIGAIDTYASEMGLKFFTGEESLDNYDAFVEKMNEMGLPRLLELRQAAYDRFLAR